MEKVAQSGDHVRDLAQAVGSVARRFALSGQWAWAWQTAEEHEWFAIITSYDIIEDGSIFQGNL